MKKRILALALVLCLAFSMGVTASAVEDEAAPEAVPAVEVTATEEAAETSGIAVSEGITVTDGNYTVPADATDATITISGPVTLTGTGDAFTIGADTELVFKEGASLTLTGYDNAFVVENATLSGGGWVINDGDGMDLFRLKTEGKLDLTGDVDLNGCNDAETSRAIVLASGSGQEVTLAENATLAANNFYRGVETGGASNYTISGADMDSSTFDFSENDCGMYLSYFDSDAHFEDCKLEVSNCPTSGIFMRQDNAALNGLYITRVNINCVNSTDLDQNDIAIRFHSNNFTITDSIINIENAWNTGLWIFDGWNANEQNKIIDTEITVKNVEAVADSALYGNTLRSKAITMVPYRPWLISGCTITMEGSGASTSTQGGLNVANGTTINRDGLNVTAVPSMCGGTIILEDTKVYTENLSYADIGVQVGQFLTVGANTVIVNDHNDSGWTEHFTILCDSISEKYPVRVLTLTLRIDYDTVNMTEEQMVDDRVTTIGGSYWSSENESLKVYGVPAYEYSLPINTYGDELKMFRVSETSYNDYMPNGTIDLKGLNGTSYSYSAAEKADEDDYRYIWAPAVTVTLVGTDSTTSVEVPCGAAFGLTQVLEPGSWTTEDGLAFTENTPVTGDITVTVG